LEKRGQGREVKGTALSDKFFGTVFLPGGERDDAAILKQIAEIDDVLVMILPEGEDRG